MQLEGMLSIRNSVNSMGQADSSLNISLNLNVQNVDGGNNVGLENKESQEEKNCFKLFQKNDDKFNVKYTNLKFSIHEKTHEVMVKVVDQKSGEIIREIPPEKLLDALAAMWEFTGILIDKKA
ncbi:flagellar protein FlaG [Bacillota bacterium LX-D]|nr:flagellar protein FlaG [Bacillota bacterium LX-D]